MGWWPFGGSASTEPSPPTREERQKCWESRDAYFVCLDRAGVVKPGTEGKACSNREPPVRENLCPKLGMYAVASSRDQQIVDFL
ncbi:hypothetical protein R3P38DRAFT_2849572 [Favolaschia claudopus]|uniref:Uncharacterized protein n=1 Tax=Favolaschia claudopus TaxID=2862362 RepID=A0AAW0DX34_9AGAR